MNEQPLPCEVYYYMTWRAHTIRLIAVLSILSNCIIWSIVAGFYGSANLAIWLVVAAVFFMFVTAIKIKDVNYYYDRMKIFEDRHQDENKTPPTE